MLAHVSRCAERVAGSLQRDHVKGMPLPIQFNHLLIFARDKRESAHFLTSLFGLPDPTPAGFFLAVDFANDVTLHYGEPGVDFLSQHYAFLVSDEEFDAIFSRLQERDMTFWADPQQRLPGQINTNHGGRGVYFMDPSGHGLEIITRPYGSADPAGSPHD
jgi:catechol 2,3-dioxygenase-like lactoylglutathione lyase family enzyme